MTRILADHEQYAAAFDKLALIANALHAGTNFHDALFSSSD